MRTRRPISTVTRMLEFMKLMRSQALSVKDLTEHMDGMNLVTVYGWVHELTEQGILVETVGPRAARLGPLPRVYRLSSLWGGHA